MFRFDDILEHWAEIYKPISHSPDPTQKHTAFYRVDMINSDSQFVRNLNLAPSPALAYSTVLNVEYNDGVLRYGHTMYFLVKQRSQGIAKTSIQEDIEAAECKYVMNEYILDLLVYLRTLKKAALSSKIKDIETANGLRGLDFSRVSWGSVPVKYNGWWVCVLGLDQIVKAKNCLLEERYKEGSIASLTTSSSL